MCTCETYYRLCLVQLVYRKDKVTIISDGGFDNNKVGKYEIKFKVEDSDGATYEDTATVTVIEGCNPSNVIVGRNTCEFVSSVGKNNHSYPYLLSLQLSQQVNLSQTSCPLL